MRLTVAFLISGFLAFAICAHGITVDGIADTEYGGAQAAQEWGTEYGNSTFGNVAFANGSEIDTAYAVMQGGVLYLFFGGNLESNGNQFELNCWSAILY